MWLVWWRGWVAGGRLGLVKRQARWQLKPPPSDTCWRPGMPRQWLRILPVRIRIPTLPCPGWARVRRRAIARGALQALAYCHEAGVVHGALGSGSVMLSTFDDRSAARLIVKLDNVGGAARVCLFWW